MSAGGPQWSLSLSLDMAFCSHYEVQQALMKDQNSKAQDEEISPRLYKEPMTEWSLHPGTVPAQAQRWSLCLYFAHHIYAYLLISTLLYTHSKVMVGMDIALHCCDHMSFFF